MSAPPAADASTPAARRRFWRRRGFWYGSGASLLALIVLLIALAYWLLMTVAGRDLLLAQIIARLPVGSSLTWKAVDGPLAGPLTLRGVDFRHKDIHFSAERVYLDAKLRPLLGRTLRLDALEVSGATLDIPKSDEPFTLPSWPDSLPVIDLPLTVQADALKVDGLRVLREHKPLVDIRTLRGGVDLSNGGLQADTLVADTDLGRFTADGRYQPHRDYRTDLTATAVFPATLGHLPARLGLVARGKLSKMTVALAGNAPEPVRATLHLRGRDAPDWTFAAQTAQLDLARLGVTATPTPLAFDLKASGHAGDAALSGSIDYAGTPLTIAPSRLKIEKQTLTVKPLALHALDGGIALDGHADFSDPEKATFDMALKATGLKLAATPDPSQPAAEQAVPVFVDADLALAGRIDAWKASGHAELVRDKDRATLQLAVSGDDKHATFDTLKAGMPTGSLDADGEVTWAPQLAWKAKATLAGFDPGYFAPAWKGKLSGHLASEGRQRPPRGDGSDDGYDADFVLDGLSGQLRGRRVAGKADVALQGTQGKGQLELSIGKSTIKAGGSVGDRLDLSARLQPLQLDDLLPGASGHLQGTLDLTGTREAPTLAAALDGSGLAWDGYAADRIGLHSKLPWRGTGGQLHLQGSGLTAGMALQSLELDAEGAVENLRLQARAKADMLEFALSGSARKTGTRWNGALDTLGLTPARGAAWHLRAPAGYAVAGKAFHLDEACLANAAGNALCASADWPREGIRVKGNALPLALIEPWLPPNEGRPLRLRGALDVDAWLQPRGRAWAGEVHLASPDGGLRIGDKARDEIVKYDQFSFDATFDPAKIKARLGSGFKGDGYIDATVATGWEASAPLQGEIYTNISRLVWLELFSPDLVNPTGLVEGHVSLRGTRGTPSLGGEATLSGFKGELPALGLQLSQGKARLTARPDGSADIVGSVQSGEGTLSVDGGLSWYGDATPLSLRFHGQNVLVSNTPELRAVAAPDLNFGLARDTMELRGQVVVPSADIDLERLDRGVSASADVVVLDPADPARSRTSPLDMDLAVTLGKDVKIKGFGMDGRLAGQIKVRSRPGYETTATGTLDVEGQYKAYGQKLQITRGQLAWSNNVVSDPRIDIRAERKVGDITAGIDVTGRALAPQADVWSNPEMQRSEALSYLVLGRSLDVATTAEANQVTAASAALSAGSGLLASQLGAKLGLDDAGVSQSRALGGSVVGFGKYITPKLYVSYGVSLIGSGQVLTLKYLLRKGFDIEVESSTVENRGSVNWRKEK